MSKKNIFSALLVSFITLSMVVVVTSYLVSSSQKTIQSSKAATTTTITLTGTFKIVATDYSNKTSSLMYFLQDVNSKIYTLVFSDKPNIQAGSSIKVSGTLSGNTLTTNSASITLLQAPSALSTTTVSGTKKVAIILIRFTDYDPYGKSDIRSVVFSASNSVANFWKETSYNKVILKESNVVPTGDVFGWYKITPGTGCIPYTWASQGIAAAKGAGFVESNYDYIIFGMDKTLLNGCWTSGIAGQAAGKYVWIYMAPGDYPPPAQTWNNIVAALTKTTAHEVGHLFPLSHASSYVDFSDLANPCIPTIANPFSGDCKIYDYGDLFDVMGGSYSQTNLFNKNLMGWLVASNSIYANTNGNFTIYPMETATTALQSILVPRDKNSSGVVTSYYYIEYRKQSGFDSDPNMQGLEIHLNPPYNKPSATYFMTKSPITPGMSFLDPIKGIRILNLSTSMGASQQVGVRFGCTKEICDAKDNDCDGIIDNPPVCPTPTPSPTPTPTPIPLQVGWEINYPAYSTKRYTENAYLKVHVTDNLGKPIDNASVYLLNTSYAGYPLIPLGSGKYGNPSVVGGCLGLTVTGPTFFTIQASKAGYASGTVSGLTSATTSVACP